ncbi:MAG: laccase domain-containing protein, partial [Planctomycetes bacterium]|nr:laccase domain-containing protein [Planctomycetota bacterium]
NLGYSTGDDPRRVFENRRRFAAAVSVDIDHGVVCGQVHGAEVAAITRGDRGEGVHRPSERWRGRDVVVIDEEGVFALAITADCPLVVVVDPVARALGVAHAGWRGTAVGAVEALLTALADRGAEPGRSWAAIAPSIRACCYPVGPEVFDTLEGRAGLDEARRADRLDLPTLHRHTLLGWGVDPRRLRIEDDCTGCGRARYFSHRCEGPTGRSGCWVGWRT